jgi:hypothetical protein
MPEPVIGRALLGVGQHGIGFADFLERVLSRLVAGILVGMVLHRKLAIGRLQRLLVGAALAAEHIIIIPLAHEVAAKYPNFRPEAGDLGRVATARKGKGSGRPGRINYRRAGIW